VNKSTSSPTLSTNTSTSEIKLKIQLAKCKFSETSIIQLKLTPLNIQLTKHASFRGKHHAPTQTLHIASNLLLNNTKIQFFPENHLCNAPKNPTGAITTHVLPWTCPSTGLCSLWCRSYQSLMTTWSIPLGNITKLAVDYPNDDGRNWAAAELGDGQRERTRQRGRRR
jgi:hypothetical protein